MYRIRIRDLKAEAEQRMLEAQALMAKASNTLTVAEKTLLELKLAALELKVAVLASIEEVMDGVTLEGDVEIMGKVMPVKGRVKIQPREADPTVDTK